MISLIIPTMWYVETFCDFLSEIIDFHCIGEVIIINNRVDSTPTHSVLTHSKVRMQNMPKNIYVTASWNYGASLAEYDVLAFLSDDVDVNKQVFSKTLSFMTENQETVGVVGILACCVGYEEVYNKFFKNDSIEFLNASDPDENRRGPPLGFGNLFFVHKKNWRKLPEQTKIQHGEVFIWNYLNDKKTNYVIADCRIESDMHVTCEKISTIDPEYEKIIQSDVKYCHSVGFKFEDA
jgi:hypothetical protein